MERTVNNWFDCLATELDSGDGHDRVASWLDVQARFPRETVRNALLIARQQPEADRVASERVWEEEYEREVCADTEPIWLWEPQIEPCCPECDQAVADHDRSPCAYDGLRYRALAADRGWVLHISGVSVVGSHSESD